MNDKTLSALREARDTFLRYEQLHRVKGTSDGDAKADANASLAEKISDALAGSERPEMTDEFLNGLLDQWVKDDGTNLDLCRRVIAAAQGAER